MRKCGHFLHITTIEDNCQQLQQVVCCCLARIIDIGNGNHQILLGEPLISLKCSSWQPHALQINCDEIY